MGMMWAYLIHLGYNMWYDPDCDFPGTPLMDYQGAPIYRDKMECDKVTWRKVVDFLPTQGINTLLIDLGEGVKYDSHPELAVDGSWSKREMKAELDRIRALGITPLPKLNFSACHDAWLKEYSRMLSTHAYYQVVADLIGEVVELFDTPPLFHLGLDEETAEHQAHMAYRVIRGENQWWKDAYFLFDALEKRGVRPWVWSDYYWTHPEAFKRRMPKSVLQSNWYYGGVEQKNAEGKYPHTYSQTYLDLNELGYDQVPTSSTWSFAGNTEQTVRLGKSDLDPGLLKGFMTAPWRVTAEYNYYGMLQDAVRLGEAKKLCY